MYTVDNCPHFGCGDCVYFRVDADRVNADQININQENILCKRIDHKKVKFAISWFKSYDCGQSFHLPCADFIPKHLDYADAKEWSGFEDFWKVYVKAWLPYENEDILLWFCLNDDTQVRYGVPLKKFLDGTMIQDGILMAIKKQYYKRQHKNDIGYTIINEEINGVQIDGE